MSPSADAGRRAAVERYLIANDWRALAVADNGPLGLVSGRASEAAAVADALSECDRTAAECKLLAIGPFLVAPNSQYPERSRRRAAQPRDLFLSIIRKTGPSTPPRYARLRSDDD